MTDVLTREQRSFCMSRIRGRDTTPEVLLRKALWARGLRYRLKTRLPGKPDLVFPRFHTVVFVDGCFWHSCPQHRVMPRKRRNFWERKLAANVQRDRSVTKALRAAGWQVVRVWEHEVFADSARLASRLTRLIKREQD